MDVLVVSSSQPQVLCIETIHGIGFQQPPQDEGEEKVKGYADDLHQHLSSYLNQDAPILGDDPLRKQDGVNGPVYVQSCYPPGQKDCTSGLDRLGTWNPSDKSKINHSDAPLVEDPGQQRIAHVALVYSNLEGQGPLPGASLIAVAMTVTALFRYISFIRLWGFVQMLLLAGLTQLVHHPSKQEQLKPSLRLRSDPGFKRKSKSKKRYVEGRIPTGFWAILRQLENDVAAYVCRNEMRERIRSFVLSALLRLSARDDVSGIVVNSHSNGTVIALDALRLLPPPAAEKVKAFVTAGSPLRKYIHFFRWGYQIESADTVKLWHNFWDEKDPVADPLEPPLEWRWRDQVQPPHEKGLFLLTDPEMGKTVGILVTDQPVNNLKHKTGGGLPVHNYWDNKTQFIELLGKMLKQLVVDKSSEGVAI